MRTPEDYEWAYRMVLIMNQCVWLTIVGIWVVVLSLLILTRCS